MSDNPYSPSNPSEDRLNRSETVFISDSVPNESRENLKFVSRIVRGLAVFCVLCLLYRLVSVYFGFRILGNYYGWTGLHTLTAVRAAYIPVLGGLSVILWKYANSLLQVAKRRTSLESQDHVERLTWLWMAIALFAFCVICEFAMRLSVALFF